MASSTKTATDAATEATKQAQSSAASAQAASQSQTAAATSAQAAQTSAGAAEASKTTAVKAKENAAKSAESAKEQADRAAAIVSTDKTLRIDGAPADAQAVGGELDVLMSMLVTGRLTYGLYTDASAVLCDSDGAQLTAEKHI